MKLSVIVAIHNAEDTIRRCLDSCLNQSFRDFEVICVDDASEDHSAEIAMDYAQKHGSHFSFYSLKQSGGAGCARNAGIAHAKGEYITFLNGDDALSLTAFERMMKVIEEKKVDILVYDAYLDYGNHQIFSNSYPLSEEGYLTAREYFIGSPDAWSKVIHRKIVERGLYFPEGIWSCDLACMPMIALIEDVKIYYLKQPLYYYNQTNDSTTRVSEFRVKHMDVLKALNSLRQNSSLFSFQKECEYLAYKYALQGLGWFLYCDHRMNYLNEVIYFMQNAYPNWMNNEYVKKEDGVELKRLKYLYQKKYKRLDLYQRFHRIRKAKFDFISNTWYNINRWEEKL